QACLRAMPPLRSPARPVGDHLRLLPSQERPAQGPAWAGLRDLSQGDRLAPGGGLRPRPDPFPPDRTARRRALRRLPPDPVLQGYLARLRQLPQGRPPCRPAGGKLRRLPQPKWLGALAL